jgi:outer membrane biosynthesis protein TonB
MTLRAKDDLLLPEPVGDEPARSSGPARVQLVELNVPFWNLTMFMVKASFAAALATVITSVLWVVIGAVLGVLMFALGMAMLTALGLLGASVAATTMPEPVPAPPTEQVAPDIVEPPPAEPDPAAPPVDAPKRKRSAPVQEPDPEAVYVNPDPARTALHFEDVFPKKEEPGGADLKDPFRK